MNPRHVACFSGGHSSALVAVEVVRRHGTEGVAPTERVAAPSFWADARKRVRGLPVLDAAGRPVQLSLLGEETDARPCECVYRKPERASPPAIACTCGAFAGEGHALHCARVMEAA